MYHQSKLIRCIPLLGYLAVFFLITLTISLKYEEQKEHALDYEKFEVYLVSAYYYNISKSLGNGSVALLLTADFEIVDSVGEVTLIGKNATDAVTRVGEMHSVPPHRVCRWIPIFVTVPLLENMEKLYIDIGNRRARIPFKPAIVEKHEVVTCVAPLFANEQWQLALLSIHIHNRFGAFLHVYVRSMISPLFDLLQIYEKEGYLTIEPWLRIQLSTISEKRFNPNLNVEFRNQAGAQTDCLLKYKESAEFISFVDLDDVLIPRMGSTYGEEFRHLFNNAPYASFLHYTKENVELKAQKFAEDYSVSHMLMSIEYEHATETGKMIAKPENINYTWIHWPDDGLMPHYKIPSDINSITHLKNIKIDKYFDEKTSDLPSYEPYPGYRYHPRYLFSREDRDALQKDFERIKQLANDRNIMDELPSSFFYSQLVANCYEDTFYFFHNRGLHYKLKCPGPERCNFPESPGIECQNANAIYLAVDGEYLNIHYHERDHFEIEDGSRLCWFLFSKGQIVVFFQEIKQEEIILLITRLSGTVSAFLEDKKEFFCLAPLFTNEQWQLALLSFHIHNRFGAFLHVYVRSMISPLFDLLQIYEKEGYLTIEPWLRIQLSIIISNSFIFNIFSLKYEEQKEHALDYEKFEVYLVSAYYYNISKSLGNGSVALLLTADFEIVDSVGEVTLIGKNATDAVTRVGEMHSVPPHRVCRWIPIFVTVPLLENMEKLYIDIGNRRARIPFKPAIVEKHEVVTCVAPLFANEQWQLALLSIHIHNRFGAFLHVYVRSMISPLFDLLQIYEKEGYLTIEPWLRIQLSTISEKRFNPNLNVEFRNQAGAQTDCLLKYKESAEFISFVDLDDVLIPRMGSTYGEEFRHLFNNAPYASFLHYTKENVELKAQKFAEDYSVSHMLMSIEYEHATETGKMIAKPENINYTWIHWPDDGLMPHYKIPSDINSITHLKNIKIDKYFDEKTSDLPSYEPYPGYRYHPRYLFSREDRDALQKDFERIKQLANDRNIMDELPSSFFYSQLVANCYEDTFYFFHNRGLHYKLKCPGPERCNFPESPGIECQNANAIYLAVDGEYLNIHYHERDHFEIEDGSRLCWFLFSKGQIVVFFQEIKQEEIILLITRLSGTVSAFLEDKKEFFCLAPLFTNEQWQLALLSFHIHNRFGAFLHVYVRSMISPLFDLLQIYEKEGYLTIEPWLRIQLSIIISNSFIFNIFSLKYEEQKEHALDYEKFEVYLVSAYYYNISKSLGNGSVALLLTADFEIVDSVGEVTLIGKNATDAVTRVGEMHSVPPHRVCRWIPIFVTVPLLENMEKLYIDIGNRRARIPFKPAIVEKHEVVTCVAPLFANEQWQLALLSIHIHNRFGAFLHVYVRSMISPLFDLLQIYEKEGYLTIEPWLRIQLSTISEKRFNPNLNVEFRNQAGAQTDCLLKYKESAEFISFVDLDDVLIPRMGSTYGEEFRYLGACIEFVYLKRIFVREKIRYYTAFGSFPCSFRGVSGGRAALSKTESMV